MENKWNSFWEQAKGKGKMPKKSQLLLVFLVGLLLLVIVFPVPDKKEADTAPGAQDEAQDGSRDSADSAEAYEEYLEKRVASALEYVDGVGRAEVVITLRSSGQKVVEKDASTNSQATSEEDSTGGTRSVQDNTSDQSSIYEQKADGTQTPYVSKELTPEIEGVLVIADGGDDAVVVQNITEAIQALFGVEAHKIKIMKRTAT